VREVDLGEGGWRVRRAQEDWYKVGLSRKGNAVILGELVALVNREGAGVVCASRRGIERRGMMTRCGAIPVLSCVRATSSPLA
jgi:hypothetical protein